MFGKKYGELGVADSEPSEEEDDDEVDVEDDEEDGPGDGFENPLKACGKWWDCTNREIQSLTFTASFEENAYGNFVLSCLTKKPKYNPFCSSLVLLIGTFTVQMLFASYMVPAISKNEHAEFYAIPKDDGSGSTTNLFTEWRACPTRGNYTDAHNKMSTPTAFSACTQHEWSWEQDKIEEMQKFTGYLVPNPKWRHILRFVARWRRGTVFGILTLIVWSATMLKATREGYTQFRLGLDHLILPVCCHPRKAVPLQDPEETETQELLRKLLKQVEDDKQRIAKESYNWTSCRFKLAMSATLIMRFLVICFLAVYGTCFLAHTDNLKDFILNSVALGFVLEIPELFFTAFASLTRKKRVQDDIKATEKEIVISGIEAKTSGWICTIVAGTGVVWGVLKLIPSAHGLHHDALDQLCAIQPGNATAGFWQE